MAAPKLSESPASLSFAAKIESEDLDDYLYTVRNPATLQLNITKACNLACKHCHVGSEPTRTEEMDSKTLQACLNVFAAGPFVNLDVTGGAPELNSHYRWFIEEATQIAAKKRASGLSPHIMTRTNAAILTKEGFSDLPVFWADHGIEVVASLPHYEEHKTNRMRGEGVFAQVVEGLRALNAVGYGQEDGQLVLSLVLNPGGAILPPAQASAEAEFKRELMTRFGITFNHLLAITNNPVGRFKEFLEDKGLHDSYLAKLYESFNPATVAAAMCRNQASVDVDGTVYDCDFNQSAALPILKSCKTPGYPLEDGEGKAITAVTVFDLEREGIDTVCERRIRTADHCYACTAGAGSSCGGTTA